MLQLIKPSTQDWLVFLNKMDWNETSAPAFTCHTYLTMISCGLHAVIALWSPHAELTLVCGTVHHSGWSKDCLHQQQHHQNQQQDVIGLLWHTQTNRDKSDHFIIVNVAFSKLCSFYSIVSWLSRLDWSHYKSLHMSRTSASLNSPWL